MTICTTILWLTGTTHRLTRTRVHTRAFIYLYTEYIKNFILKKNVLPNILTSILAWVAHLTWTRRVRSTWLCGRWIARRICGSTVRGSLIDWIALSCCWVGWRWRGIRWRWSWAVIGLSNSWNRVWWGWVWGRWIGWRRIWRGRVWWRWVWWRWARIWRVRVWWWWTWVWLGWIRWSRVHVSWYRRNFTERACVTGLALAYAWTISSSCAFTAVFACVKRTNSFLKLKYIYLIYFKK